MTKGSRRMRDVFAKTKPFPSYIKPKKADQSFIKKDGGEMPVSIVLDRPLDEAKALVEDPDRLISEITAILESKQSHPLLDQMLNPDARDDIPIADFTAASSSSGSGLPRRATQTEVPQDRFQWRDARSGDCQRGRPTTGNTRILPMPPRWSCY